MSIFHGYRLEASLSFGFHNGLVNTFPAKFTAFTKELKNAKILKRELNERASRYTHFELKNITIDENKFPLLAQNRIAASTVYFYHLMEILE